MKNKDFETAITGIQELAHDLAKRGALNNSEINQVNNWLKSLIGWYNFQTGTDAQVVYPWNDPYFIAVWEKWRAYKKQQFRFTYKPIAEQSALKNLSEIAKGDMGEAVKIIEKAISNGHMGLYPSKGKSTFAKPKTSNTYKQNLANRLTQQP